MVDLAKAATQSLLRNNFPKIYMHVKTWEYLLIRNDEEDIPKEEENKHIMFTIVTSDSLTNTCLVARALR